MLELEIPSQKRLLPACVAPAVRFCLAPAVALRFCLVPGVVRPCLRGSGRPQRTAGAMVGA